MLYIFVNLCVFYLDIFFVVKNRYGKFLIFGFGEMVREYL